MKISWKIFCSTYIVIFVAIAMVCMSLMEQNFDEAWILKKDEAMTGNSTATQIFLLMLKEESPNQKELLELEQNISNVVYRGEKSDFQILSKPPQLESYDEIMENLQVNQQGYWLVRQDQTLYLQVISVVKIDYVTYYLQTMEDLTELLNQREKSVDFCKRVILAAACMGGIILFIISYIISKPIQNLSRSARNIAEGNYSNRISEKGSDEIALVAKNFNQMAAAIQSKIKDLNLQLERRERFIADFTHELKTPMTTIIGYSDMLRSYELQQNEVRDSGNQIYREAKRLERLSMRLLDVLVLENSNPDMHQIDVENFWEEVKTTCNILGDKYHVNILIETESFYAVAEQTLLLSLFYNLIDNACKASEAGENIYVVSKKIENRWITSVQDFGCGIGKEHLDDVTEPFYMEDKSRSRSRGGAGLGLTLCGKIVDMHQGEMHIKSIKGEGTTITIGLPLERG